MRVLIIEDQRACSDAMSEALRDEGFVVDCVDTLRAADDAVAVMHYDAVVSERTLPDGDGLDWVRAQRRNGSPVPILLTTGDLDAVGQRVEGLNAGADDYVIKPIALDELVARLRAVMRRPSTTLDPVLQIGNVTFAPVSREVRVDGQLIKLPRRETCILELLIRRPGKITTKRILEEGLYSFEADVSSNAIEVGVYRLRGHLMSAGATAFVRTVRGTGYVFEEPGDTILVQEAARPLPEAMSASAQFAAATAREATPGSFLLLAIAATLSSGPTPEMRVAMVTAALAAGLSQADVLS